MHPDILSNNADIAEFCASLATEEFITVDTEFMRESTYWPKLCLIQIGSSTRAVAIDPLAECDLSPLWEVLKNPKILKVFHAARQDLEIFWKCMGGILPAPIFDSQIAAMAAGFGEQVSYETLATQLAKAKIDKSSRFTDWSRRPLSDKQIAYALDDVIHLRVVYTKIQEKLAKNGREDWLLTEMAKLTEPALYNPNPRDLWKRIKIRSDKPRVLAVLQELAVWRELEAQQRDIPRGRILKDDALAEIALALPKDSHAFETLRALPKGFANSSMGRNMMAAVQAGLAMPDADCPRLPRLQRSEIDASALDLLRALLKICATKAGIAPRLLADSDDLETILREDSPDIACMQGWRFDAFGKSALALKAGQISLSIQNGNVTLRETP